MKNVMRHPFFVDILKVYYVNCQMNVVPHIVAAFIKSRNEKTTFPKIFDIVLLCITMLD